MKERVLAFICDYFVQKDKFTKEDAASFLNENYFEKKMLDSIEFIMLLTDIENEFEITFSQEELQSPEFSTINGITNIVMTKIS